MTFVFIALLLVPLLDQALKIVLRRTLGAGTIKLGPLGRVRVITNQIWWTRAQGGPPMSLVWTIWAASAGMLVALALAIPTCAWGVGLLLGGSLSHLLETAARGCVVDYICLRFWPEFNLADVAITLGSIGIVLGFAARLHLLPA